MSEGEFKLLRHRATPDRKVLWGKRRRFWNIEPEKVLPPDCVRVTVGSGISLEGWRVSRSKYQSKHRFRFTYQEVVESGKRNEDAAAKRGERWIKRVALYKAAKLAMDSENYGYDEQGNKKKWTWDDLPFTINRQKPVPAKPSDLGKTYKWVSHNESKLIEEGNDFDDDLCQRSRATWVRPTSG